jgi:hypothetical protein
MANRPPLLPRFWRRVNKKGPIAKGLGRCWVWTAGKFQGGYGAISVGNKTTKAHRISWIIHYGKLTDTDNVLHKCDNPSCVNPKHLFLGTLVDNRADCVSKNRQVKGEKQHSAKLNEGKVRSIRERYVYGCRKNGSVALAREFGVGQPAILRVVKKLTWKHIR